MTVKVDHFWTFVGTRRVPWDMKLSITTNVLSVPRIHFSRNIITYLLIHVSQNAKATRPEFQLIMVYGFVA